MAVSPRNRWSKRLVWAALVLVGLIMAIWPAAILYGEYADSFNGSPPPSQLTAADPRFESAIQRARHQVHAMMAERRIPGLAIAVAVDGEIIWSEAFGYADLENRVPATTRTLFRVQSVSKLLTVAGMARLYEQGILDLDAPIRTYVPEFPDSGAEITARRLASHRSGIRHYRDDLESLNRKRYRSAVDSIEKFKDDPLAFKPDSNFLYSSYGFVLLSAVMERASGEDFPALMRREVFEPLGMRHTLAEHAGHTPSDQSRPYDHVTPYSSDGSVVPSPDLDFSSKWAGGGFLSTAEDLVRFGSAHLEPLNEGFLKGETIRILFTPRTRHFGIFSHGLGWASAPDPHLRRSHFHFGAGSGGTAILFVHPRDRVVLAIAANLGHARFPSNRLARIRNPFLSDPAMYVIIIFWTLATACAVIVAARRRRREPEPRRN